MEENVFHRPEVFRELKNYVEGRRHTDVDAPWSHHLRDIKDKRHNGDRTTPIYEIVDPGTLERIDIYSGVDVPTGKKFTNELLVPNKNRSLSAEKPGLLAQFEFRPDENESK